MSIGQHDAAGAFQAAAGIDPATLQTTISSVIVLVVLLWGANYLRRVASHGWRQSDLGLVGTGALLVLVLLFFVFWVVGQYGSGI